MMAYSNKPFYFSCFFVLSLITVFPLYNFNSFFQDLLPHAFQAESSVWCVKGSGSANLCKFKNVCYDARTRVLLFFLSEQTIIKGLNHYTDLQKISLSSVDSHNQFYANISVVMRNDIYQFKKKIKIAKKTYLISRFKSNNAMHVMHDDLFPLFLTLEYLCANDRNCMESYSLIILDNYSKGPFFELYKLFSLQNPIVLNQQSTEGDHIFCFEEMLTGLVQDGTFYQYGFNKPHGPVNNPFLTANDILRFTSFVKEKLRISTEHQDVECEVLIIHRQKTRRILNIDDVLTMVKRIYKKTYGKEDVKIIVKDLLSTKIDYFIKLMCDCHLVIGMHGAEMIFTIFNKPHSIVVELFPFGIQPEVVSFIKPISQLEDSHMKYFSWKNNYRNNSVAHPRAHPLFGGINHLDEGTKNKIKKIQNVPAVECCNDPTYLYHMYQDTIVGSEFEIFLTDSLSSLGPMQTSSASNGIFKKWFHPYGCLDVGCEFRSRKRLLVMHWSPPFNVKATSDLEYNIYVKDEKSEFSHVLITKSLHSIVNVTEKVGTNPNFHMWISVRYEPNDSKSRDSHLICPCV